MSHGLTSSTTSTATTTSSSVKRCYNQYTENAAKSSNIDDPNNEADSEEGASTCLSGNHQPNNDADYLNCVPKNKRLALRQCLVSRYHEEFHEVCRLGSGEFGDVFKCINRLDGCTYAIKRSKRPIAGSALEVSAWKEVCAHAVLVKHGHIVQYYSAWAEADRMLIQNEYCNGGSLAEFIDALRCTNMSSSPQGGGGGLVMSEQDLKILLLHVAKGIGYMHSLNLVHLDIKPGNIFICRTPRRQSAAFEQSSGAGFSSLSSSLQSVTASTAVSMIGGGQSMSHMVVNEESGIESEDMDDEDSVSTASTCSQTPADQKTSSTAATSSSSFASIFSEVITYKIGDLGHVTSTLDPHVEEGDCRYLPNEILQEQYDHLPKADVFALALTVHVSGSLQDLPKNGDEWHSIRHGGLANLGQCSERFNKLLQSMVNENPVLRPSASTLVHHPCILPDANKSKAQLRKELNQEKFKNEMLQQQVKKYEQALCTSSSSSSSLSFGSSALLSSSSSSSAGASAVEHQHQVSSSSLSSRSNILMQLKHQRGGLDPAASSKFTRSFSSTFL